MRQPEGAGVVCCILSLPHQMMTLWLGSYRSPEAVLG
jgi:hypothetical protein